MTYYRLLLGVLTGILFYVTMCTRDIIYSDNVIMNVRTFVIKNSTNVPEDRTITQDPDEQEDLPHPGVFWLPSQEVYFTSAFLDTRYNGSVVRIVGVQHRNHREAPLCVFGEGEREVRVPTEVHFVFPHWPARSLYVATMYSCPTPAVGAKGHLGGYPYNRTCIRVCSQCDLPCVKISLNHPHAPGARGASPRQDMAICGKAYSGGLDWRRLVEWFETNRLVGVSSVIVYDDGIRGRARRVVEYYRGVRFVRKLPFPLLRVLHEHAIKSYSLSKEEYFSISQQVYLASLNDCILRYGARYEFFLIIDYDETLIPARDESVFFTALRHAGRHPHTAGLTFYTAWHFADFPTTTDRSDTTTTTPSDGHHQHHSGNTNHPHHTSNQIDSNYNTTEPYLYTLEHNRRTAVINNQPKSVIRAASVLSVNWHSVIRTHPGSHVGLNTMIKPANDSAYVHHYRGRCVDKFLFATCDAMLATNYVDDVVPRYAERMRMRIGDVYMALRMRGP